MQREKATRAAVQSGLRDAAHFGRALLVRQTDQLGKVDQGQFRNSWRVAKEGAPPTAGGFQDYQIVNDAPYAGIIERGARPHPVSPEGIEALTHWARRKLGLSLDEAAGVAHAIAWKLRRHGQRPTWLVRESLPELGRMLRTSTEAKLRRASGQRQTGGAE